MPRTLAAFALLSLSLCCGSASAAPDRVEFTETTLKNGLRVQLAPDSTAPVIALHIAYDVGSKDERKGLTGFAHLFEHMMFKGSENVGDGEHFYQIFTSGGVMNGTTSPDMTNYYETLPANQLEMALFLEADRMRSLEITQEKLDNQRHAVQEERRLRIDNQPYGRSFERLGELLYDNFAYKHSTIGSMEDLNAASIEDVDEFFKTYYAPNNAVLSLVGDFEPDEAMRLIRKYFEPIPRQPEPPRVDLKEPQQTAERRETISDPLARLPHAFIVYKTVPGNTPDQYALEVLGSVLFGGDSSRLYQKLNKELELVAGIGGFVDERIGTGSLRISATMRPGREIKDMEAALYEEIERIQREPIAAWELEKAKNSTRYGYYSAIRGTQSRAMLLGAFTIKFNDPNLINTRMQKVEAVTAADVQRVARQYLRERNRTVLITMPAAAATAGL
ncbi:MAG: insulinase family protein [Xanthomonadaceae bacterium]|nr:insulinase family protein [Xanthomonadaceae bacterium]